MNHLIKEMHVTQCTVYNSANVHHKFYQMREAIRELTKQLIEKQEIVFHLDNAWLLRTVSLH